ncbi:MAG: AraC family transcriptional regulator [Capsulimonas sp.]|nr:AraC family transcriptional regulator [Capsulimonas sp.]
MRDNPEIREDAARERDSESPMELSEINQGEQRTEQFHQWDATHRQTWRPLWHMDIVPLPEMPLFLYPMSISVQATNDPRYTADGHLRAGQDYCYFCYTLAGTGGFSDAQGMHYVSEGDAFLTEISDPETRYFYPGVDRKPWEFLAFNFRGLAARAMTRELVSNYGSIYHLSPQSPIIKRMLGFESSPYTTIHPHALDGAEIVLELLLALAASARERAEPDPAMDLIKQALEIIDRDLELDLNVGTLARTMGVNREYLSRAFQKCVQRSPKEILMEMKIRRASFLLKDTDISIKQIAARLGYSDYTNFIRAFRSMTKMTPSEFRQHGSISLPEPLRRKDGAD